MIKGFEADRTESKSKHHPLQAKGVGANKLFKFLLHGQPGDSISVSAAVAAAYQRGVARAVLAQHLAWVLSRW